METKGPNRREFIKSLSVGLAGGYISLKARTSLAMHGGGGGGTIIDPPVGGVLKDPVRLPNLSTTPGIVRVNLEPRIASINVNGTRANLMTYNGSFPGPTIRVKKGDVLEVNFKNSLPSTTSTNILGHLKNITNIHTHGWHVSPQPPSDAVRHLEIAPGETYKYVYDTDLQEAGTLSFYHPHKHGLTAEQVWAGLSGALVVEDETPLLAPYETHILVLKDIALSGSAPAPHSSMMDYMNGKEGNTVMVNGQVNPRLYMKTGQVQRWRLLNASNTRFYKLSLENHSMYLIGADGGLLDKAYPRSELLLSPGERVDVLVKGTRTTGNHRLRALPYSKGSMMGMGGSQTVTLMTMTYNGSASSVQNIPASINPDARRLNLNTSAFPKRTITLSMGQGNAYINGRDYDTNPFTLTSKAGAGAYEVWTIVNQSNMDHPFHQHVNPAQVLSVSGGDSGYASLYTTTPAWKDTVLVPRGGSVTLLVPVLHYTGTTVFHCHILEHEDIGMMGDWNIV